MGLRRESRGPTHTDGAFRRHHLRGKTYKTSTTGYVGR